jgi:hypothetical protein
MRLGKSAGVGQKRLDGGDGCSQGGHNQLQQRVWRVRVRLSLGAKLPRPNRRELLNYFRLEFVQGFRAGHTIPLDLRFGVAWFGLLIEVTKEEGAFAIQTFYNRQKLGKDLR